MEESIALVNNEHNKLVERNSLLEKLFSDISNQLGFSVLEYENTTGNLIKEKKKQYDLLSRDLSEITTKISFENKKRSTILLSIANVEKAITDNTKLVEEIKR